MSTLIVYYSLNGNTEYAASIIGVEPSNDIAILKIDADMMVITSVGLINSPPFVPMMASAMNNRKLLVPGITIGIIGFAVGNYLGILAERVFSLF